MSTKFENRSTLSAVVVAGCLFLVSGGLATAERINHEGRILGPAPVVTNALLFNTPEADAVVAGMQIMPRDNAWNEDVSRRPLLSNSEAMIAQIVSDLSSSRRALRAFTEMNFALVPDNQPLVPIDLNLYADESDPSPYPIPSNLPIETWPAGTGGLSLYDWQRDIKNTGGDRHAIIVQPGTGAIWETWLTLLVVTNGQTNWQAANGAKFNLNSNASRPSGWTSADAAGLSMFAGLVRYDECQRGMVEHAIRCVVARSRREYIYPATHFASSYTTPDRPAMGQRLRLKSSFQIPANWSKEEQAVLRGLKKYGALVADNGGFFSISVAPDQRFSGSAFGNLSTVSVTNFEVIQSTGPTGGPRSAGAPTVDAGADFTASPGVAVALSGGVRYTNTAPLTIQWKLYAGPGQVTFGDASRTNTSATFSTPGTYQLLLSAEDGVHTPAYDAVTVTVRQSLNLRIQRTGTNVTLSWTGGTPPFQVQTAGSLIPSGWQTMLTINGTSFVARPGAGAGFYRVQ